MVEWQIVEWSTNILQIFAEVTKEISSERYVSMSKVLIFIRSMNDTIEELSNQHSLTKLSSRFGHDVIGKIKFKIFKLRR